MSLATAFERDGYAVVEGVVDELTCTQLGHQLALPDRGAGSRSTLNEPWCSHLAQALRAHPRLSDVIAPDAVAVQCTYFEKSAQTNWLVPVHQDLSIPVAGRVDAPELRGWSVKNGVTFVQAPLAVLEQLVAVRLHLDPCGPEDGPLCVVPGSHQRGLITDAEASSARLQGEVPCHLGVGGVLLMRPLLLHRSSKSTGTSRRRVLHFLFGPARLPTGLAWAQAV